MIRMIFRRGGMVRRSCKNVFSSFKQQMTAVKLTSRLVVGVILGRALLFIALIIMNVLNGTELKNVFLTAR